MMIFICYDLRFALLFLLQRYCYTWSLINTVTSVLYEIPFSDKRSNCILFSSNEIPALFGFIFAPIFNSRGVIAFQSSGEF